MVATTGREVVAVPLPPDERSGPPVANRRGRSSAQVSDTDTTARVSDRSDISGQLPRRRAASYRCPPLRDGRRDPLYPDPLDPTPAPRGPSTFGLTPHALREHANALAGQGWTVEEILAVLAIEPRSAAHCACCARSKEMSAA